MNRRNFFAILTGAATAATAAAAIPLVPMPELDVGRRIFLPPKGGWRWRPVSFHPAVFRFLVELQPIIPRIYDTDFAPRLNSRFEFSNDGGQTFASYTPGDVVTIRRPPRYTRQG